MPKRQYVLALACYLAIPAALIAGTGLFLLIDPEMARGHADYVRVYQWLELTRLCVPMAAAGLALVFWTATCFLVLKSRQRSLRWLPRWPPPGRSDSWLSPCLRTDHQRAMTSFSSSSAS